MFASNWHTLSRLVRWDSYSERKLMTKRLKYEKQGLKDLAAKAHEAELNHVYLELTDYFADWQEGKISSLELSTHINRIQQGPVREIGNMHIGLTQEMRIARAVALNFLTLEELPDGIRTTVMPHVLYYSHMGKGDPSDTVFEGS